MIAWWWLIVAFGAGIGSTLVVWGLWLSRMRIGG